ncbi:MAG: hypothetical protein K9N06_12260 [Candidatus Cloacimonetes bacterium]|nr:hypothetical protein [Candidatus Cloacimonadota bacterium]
MYKQLVFLLFFCWFGYLCGCDMFALLLKDGCSFADCSGEVDTYFDYLISRSSNTTNNDGYGIIAYREGDLRLQEGDYWYKTGNSTWYGDGTYDILDEAKIAILEAGNHYFLVIGHARNASVGAGSHPFRLENESATISMCHNGVIAATLLPAMMEYLGEIWFEEYPSNWSGVYGNVGSFIDSELYFHYLAKEIFYADNDVLSGISNALENTNLLGINISESILGGNCSANFLLADGESLYAFRNTSPASAGYRLSWAETDELFAVKTQTVLTNIFQQNELIKFQRDGVISTVILEAGEEEEFVPAAQFYAHPNPFQQEVDLVYCPSRKDDNNHDDVTAAELVKVYNMKGQLLRNLNSETADNGISYFHWDGYNYSGRKAAAGVYLFLHTQSGKNTKAVFIK